MTKSEVTAKLLATSADRVRVVGWKNNMIEDIFELTVAADQGWLPMKTKAGKLSAHVRHAVDDMFLLNPDRVTVEELHKTKFVNGKVIHGDY
jgi:aminoglycoside phosphotransferase